MKKNKIIGALALMMMGTTPAFAAENKAADFQASAEVENVCLIEADDVNFGQVYAPLTQQGTKSEMRVLCSKGTSYTVDLNYGGNFVDPNGNSNVSAKLTYKTTDSYNDENPNGKQTGYRLYVNGEPISNGYPGNSISSESLDMNLNNDGTWGDVLCYTATPNIVTLRTKEAAELFGVPFANEKGTFQDNSGICDPYSSRLNISSFNSFFGNSNSDKGVMIGAMKGNALAYQITMPGDITKPWISNVNSYKATASGEFDKIEVNARIMPDSSSSLYPAQDSYFDTVTAVISY